jgi:hypothetical protein
MKFQFQLLHAVTTKTAHTITHTFGMMKFATSGKEQIITKNVISLKAYITGLIVKNEKIQHIAMGASFGIDKRSRR